MRRMRSASGASRGSMVQRFLFVCVRVVQGLIFAAIGLCLVSVEGRPSCSHGIHRCI